MVEFKHIVRIANTDLEGNKQIAYALRKIKGLGFMFANTVCNIAKIEKAKKTGELSDDEINKLNDIVVNPNKYNIPEWMMNRRRDCSDGISRHLVTSDLTFNQDNDIKMMKKMKSYRGIRHMLGLPVRGQRTKSNFRKNKGKVHLGVKHSSKTGRV